MTGKLKYDPPLRYLVRVFTAGGVEVPSAAPSALRETLELDADLRLRVVQMLDVGSGKMTNGAALSSTDEAWLVYATPESIDIAYSPAKGHTTPVLDYLKFIGRASKSFSVLMSSANVLGTRIAALSEGFLPEMGESELDEIAHRLLRWPASFSPAPWEWDWRCVSSSERKFGDHREECNSLLAARRLQGAFPSGETFDRIRLDIDINTHAKGNTSRFSGASVQAFLNQYPNWYNNLKDEIESFMFGTSV